MPTRNCSICNAIFSVKYESIRNKTCSKYCSYQLRGKSSSNTWAQLPDEKRFNQKDYNHRYYLSNRENIIKQVKDYKIRTGYKYKLNEQQKLKSNSRSREWYQANKQIVMDRSKAWKKENRDKVRANTRAYSARRANAIGHFATKDYMKLLRRSLNMCFYCGVKRANSIDHVLPLSRGGTNYIGNIVPACGSCNYSKGPRTVAEWKHGKSICTRDVRSLYGVSAL